MASPKWQPSRQVGPDGDIRRLVLGVIGEKTHESGTYPGLVGVEIEQVRTGTIASHRVPFSEAFWATGKCCGLKSH